jgi:D-alanyl-lipoteichoic acid acyltransferase DltB (MBOAT superfamily)
MLFNSLEFIIFFPVVIFFYFLIPHKWRWVLLLAASYYFYMCWEVKYLVIILVTTLVNYFIAIQIEKQTAKRRRRLYLYLSLFITLGILFTFKYLNFINDNLRLVLKHFNIVDNFPSLHLLLPLGISFYTFQILAYIIEVYRGNVKAERHAGIFALYVSFFPTLVAGPIQRPRHLIPQFYEKHPFDYQNFTNGLKLMAWGFFKKLVIADRLAVFIDEVYKSPNNYYGFQVAVAAIFFMIQLYADFSGYSDIAIGAARVMGIRLTENFDRPHISKSITEFWKRWHISLSTWIKDYIFMPLASYLRKWRIWGFAFAGFISLLLFGIWHGAGWNFAAFGVLFGLFYAFETLTFRQRKRLWSKVPSYILNPVGVVFTFSLIALTSIFFRAKSFQDAITLFNHLWQFNSNQLNLSMINNDKFNFVSAILFICILILFQRLQGQYQSVVHYISSKSVIFKWSFYILLVYIILTFGIFNNKEFYYFQF